MPEKYDLLKFVIRGSSEEVKKFVDFLCKAGFEIGKSGGTSFSPHGESGREYVVNVVLEKPTEEEFVNLFVESATDFEVLKTLLQNSRA